MPGVPEPDDLSVGGVEKRNSETLKIKRAVGSAARVALGLRENVLRAERNLLSLDKRERAPVVEERVVNRPVLCLVFLKSIGTAERERTVRRQLPASGIELGINSRLARRAFTFLKRH